MIGIKIGQNRGSELVAAFGEVGRLERQGPVYLLCHNERKRILKPLQIGAMRAFLISKLLSARNAWNGLPSLIHPLSGKPYLWHKGSRYMMTGMLDGRIADYFETKDLQLAIGGMREFHEFGGAVLQEDVKRWRPLEINMADLWQKRFQEMSTCRSIAIRQQTRWAKQYLKFWHHFACQALQALAELKNYGNIETKVICYHDWAFHNVIINNEKAYLFDFDYMVVDQPVHDKCNLIGRYLRLFNWSNHSLFTVLWNFDRFYPWRTHEIKLLRILLMLPYDYWMFGRQLFIEKQPWSEKYYLDQWNRKIMNYSEREKVLDLIIKLE